MWDPAVTDVEAGMKRFVEGEDRRQTTLLPEYIDDYVSEENPVRVIEAFVAALDLAELALLRQISGGPRAQLVG